MREALYLTDLELHIKAIKELLPAFRFARETTPSSYRLGNFFDLTSAARPTRLNWEVDESIEATRMEESIEWNMAKLMTKVETALEKGKALGKVYSHRSNPVALIDNPPNISTFCSTTFSLILLFQSTNDQLHPALDVLIIMAGFFDLPAELRLIIYTHYFDTPKPTFQSPMWQSKAYMLTDYNDQPRKRTHLLTTSRLILREALPIYHAALELHVLKIEDFLTQIQHATQLRDESLGRLLRRQPLFMFKLLRNARLTERYWITWKRIEAAVVLKESGNEIRGEDRGSRGALLGGVKRE